MTRRRRLAVLLGIAVPLGTAGVALAASVTPPVGTPNLARMVVQRSDLPAGADCRGFGDVGYVTPAPGFSAAYQGDCRTHLTFDGLPGMRLEDSVAIAPLATTAHAYYAGQVKFFDTRLGRRLLIGEYIANASAAQRLTPADFHFSGAASAGVGTHSFVETLTITTHQAHRVNRNPAVIVLFVVDRAFVATIDLSGATRDEPVPQSAAIALARLVDTHIQTVLSEP
jgi:hypothetical protein